MILYNLITFLYLPFALLKVFSKKEFSKEEIYRVKERFGFLPKKINDSEKYSIWIHAVSVGEVNTSLSLIEELKEKYPEKNILVTTTTVTGSQRLKKIYGDSLNHQYIPFDLFFSVQKFINSWNPVCMILIDTEIWPNMIEQCSKRNIPSILLNGRLSNSSTKKYLKLSKFAKKLFSKINLIIAQSQEDKNNFMKLGAEKEKTFHDFSLKFDAANEILSGLSFNIDENALIDKKLIVCASTHPLEEKILLESFKNLDDDSCHLILVPRHPHRANEVGKIIEDNDIDFSFLEIDNQNTLNLKNNISVVNQIGHLDSIFSIADLAFIGGTLIPHGGQNFLEPVKYGLPLSSGKSIFNFKEIAAELLDLDILKQGETVEQISLVWKNQLLDSSSNELKMKGKAYLSSKKGSVKRSVEKINNILKK